MIQTSFRSGRNQQLQGAHHSASRRREIITVNVDGRDFNLPKSSQFSAFEAGKEHKFTVTLSKTSNGVNVNINKWEDDGIDYGGTAE